MSGLERRDCGDVQVRAMKRIDVCILGRMRFRVVVGLAVLRDRVALKEKLYGVVVTRWQPQIAGTMPNEFVESVGGSHVTTRSLAVTTNAVVLPVVESRAEPSATPSPVELRMKGPHAVACGPAFRNFTRSGRDRPLHQRL